MMKRDSFKRIRSKDYAEHRRLSHCLLNIRVSVEENGLTRGGVMSVFAFKEKSRVLAEQCGWSLTSVIDDCSEGFRADYLHRPLSEYALSRGPSARCF